MGKMDEGKLRQMESDQMEVGWGHRRFSQGTAWASCCPPAVLCSLPRPLLLQSLGMGPYTTMLKFVNLEK